MDSLIAGLDEVGELEMGAKRELAAEGRKGVDSVSFDAAKPVPSSDEKKEGILCEITRCLARWHLYCTSVVTVATLPSSTREMSHVRWTNLHSNGRRG